MITRASTNTTLKRSIRRTASRDKGWNRPDDWPLLSVPATGEQVIYALVAVADTDAEYAAILCQGAYTVDWGDGTVENFATNTKASRTYTFASISAPVASCGCKYIVVKITPQAGQNLTVVNFSQRPDPFTGGFGLPVGWSEMTISAPLCTSLIFGNVVAARRLAALRVVVGEISGLNLGLSTLSGLQFLEFQGSMNTGQAAFKQLRAYTGPAPAVTFAASATNMFEMFQTSSFSSLPWMDTSNITSIGSAFQNLTGLEVIPAYDFSAVTSAANAFVGTFNLKRNLATGLTVTHSYLNLYLSATALNEIFTNLGTAASGATITITGNPGAATCNQSLATDKGWEVIN
jgi:hypothetical protein